MANDGPIDPETWEKLLLAGFIFTVICLLFLIFNP